MICVVFCERKGAGGVKRVLQLSVIKAKCRTPRQNLISPLCCPALIPPVC